MGNNDHRNLTRRDFMRAVSCVALGAVLPHQACADERAPAPGEGNREPEDKKRKARVVLVRDEHAIDENGRVVANVIQRMVDESVKELFKVEEPLEAWKSLVKPSDTVGIKSNVWSPLPTPPEIERAIKERLMAAGVDQNRILVDDRGAYRTLARCTAIVNVRPLRTHHWSGIGGCIKNMIMFDSRPYIYHDDMCADLALVWKLPIVKGKVRLNFLVVLTPQFFGRGPHHFDRRFVWEYKGLMVSEDPVALDAVGVKLLEAKRREYFGQDKPLAHLAKHVRIAEERHNLGVADLSRIELVKLGWDKDILI